MPDPCPICQEDIDRLNHVRTRCDHTFCHTCFREWTSRSDTCPLCRATCVETPEEQRETFLFFRQNSMWPVFIFILDVLFSKVKPNGGTDSGLISLLCFINFISALFQYVYFTRTDNGKFNAFAKNITEGKAIEVYYLQLCSIITATLFPKFAFLWSAFIAIRLYQDMPKLQIGRFVFICSVFLTAARVPALMQVITEKFLPLTSWLLVPHAAPSAPCVLAQACATVAFLLWTYIPFRLQTYGISE
jgi:hypothetical protein